MLKYLKIAIFFFILFSLYGCVDHNKEKVVKIVFVGDLLLDRGIRQRIEHLGIDGLIDVSVDAVFKKHDFVLANLECPATKIVQPINKKYIFRSEPEWLAYLKKSGITHLNMANNHSMDQGRSGLTDTHDQIKQHGLIPLGFGENATQACNEVLLATEPRNIYVLSSLQVPSENWTYLPDEPCVCEESFDDIEERIKDIKSERPDAFIIVQLHWGFEHTLKPVLSQKQQAYQLIDAGADCIIGHHTHTIQTLEWYREKPIYYSIGNFIFDQAAPINSKGLMVKMEISKSTVIFDTTSFTIDKDIPKLN